MIKLLIVDDEKLLRKGFIHMTDWPEHGYCIAGEAGNGEEALQLIETLRPDVVVTDIKMPGMDGIELIQIIKSAYPHIEVIVLSSYSDFPYVKESLQLGAADYILKASMSFDEVLCALGKVTGQPGGNPVHRRPLTPEKGQAAERSDLFYPDNISRYKELLSEGQETRTLSTDRWLWKEIRPYIEGGDLDGLYRGICGAVVEQIENGRPPEPYGLKKSLVELGYMIIHKLDESGVNPHELQRDKVALFRQIESAFTFDTCMDSFKAMFSAIHQFLAANVYPMNKYSPTIKLVVAYLHENYAQPELSLSDVARRYHMNKSYLSQLFKQQVGENFQSYVTRIRLDQAKQRLRRNEPVNEVCFAVGIDNVSYFSQLFKRWMGVSPSDYAKELID
ncbi:response regulator [Paenibacillus thalictri]|uniref:Response regulator n=1 Tax=Paenibacillus thalictri TaxID=2527873 RepID=A0A4Q9DH36_9BACL|nr:response regulator [Paenibacillus thalictri]TBL69289.1 response regulator [Paenibacillus thalictri]